MKKFILASESLRRREILASLGIKFEVRPANIDETIPAIFKNDPENAVMHLSKLKGTAALSECTDEVIIAADTVVYIDGEILGKPSDPSEAYKMLTQLSGKTHHVFTGITVIQGDKRTTECEKSAVTFIDLTDDMISKYIKLKNPTDKAGAYGIQETASLFVSSIAGDYLNIVGLPICRLGVILRRDFQIELIDEI